MNRTTTFEIVQFNCNKANYNKARTLIDRFDPRTQKIVALQEVQENERNRSTYCPNGYHVMYEPSTEGAPTKVAFLISKEIEAGTWRVRQHGGNVMALDIELEGWPLTIINVYNPHTRQRRLATWPNIEKAIQKAKEDYILLGDFNSHHPRWGGIGARTDAQSEHLWEKIEVHQLKLLTERGRPTWSRNGAESVIDLTFGTEAVFQRLRKCQPEPGWAPMKDHYPIRIQLIAKAEKAKGHRRFVTSKMDGDKFRQRISETKWMENAEPLVALQGAMKTALEELCPRAKPGRNTRKDWSPKAARLVQDLRRARRDFTHTGESMDRIRMETANRALEKELKRLRRDSFRVFMDAITSDPETPHNRGLWRMSKWSKTGTRPAPQLTPLTDPITGEEQTDGERIVEILSTKFFPRAKHADLSDLGEDPEHYRPWADLTQDKEKPEVSAERLASIIRHTPNGKATGPDEIANEAIKMLGEETMEPMAQAIQSTLQRGVIPSEYKESTTCVLKKEGKGDYSTPGAYRPIALENTLAKIMEKIVAEDLANIAESRNMLPWNQFGGRKNRSTLSAIGFLRSCISTTWKSRNHKVFTMLSLDITGAYDHVSHTRLLHILHAKQVPAWIIRYIENFLQGRRTKIALPGYKSEWISTETGIPQGSNLSPILFLFFISELLENFQKPMNSIIGFGFVDDTNLGAWGPTAEDNCRRLAEAHEKCIQWANRHGSAFNPEKYQIMHFSKGRTAPGDLESTIRINEKPATVQKEEMRMLGVWFDPKMNWRAHIQKASRKGEATLAALGRIAGAVWGASVRRTRLLYTAVARPAMIYGIQVWGCSERADRTMHADATKKLRKIQNRCLRKVTGGYRRTPAAMLEREAAVAPIDLYTEEITLQRTDAIKSHTVETEMKKVLDQMWVEMENHRPQGAPQRHRRRKRRRNTPRPQTAMEKNTKRLEDRIAQTYRPGPAHEEGGGRGGHNHRWKMHTRVSRAIDRIWKERWEREGEGGIQATWKSKWTDQPLDLYEDLTKVEATVAFLLRTEILGLRAWLAAIRVPGVTPECQCGWRHQTLTHILRFCRRYQRATLYEKCGTDDPRQMLKSRRGCKETARWFLKNNILDYMTKGFQAMEEDRTDFGTAQDLEPDAGEY